MAVSPYFDSVNKKAFNLYLFSFITFKFGDL